MRAERESARFGSGFIALGSILFAGSVLVTAKIVWNQTVSTWRNGPRDESYALIHGSGLYLILMCCALLVWAAAALTLTAWQLQHKKRVARGRFLGFAAIALLFVLMTLPEGFWERVCIHWMAASPHAGELLVDAAGNGDLGMVEALVSRGVPINTKNDVDGRTPLHLAAMAGNIPMLQYLLVKGADVNVVDGNGDSPLEVALKYKQLAAAGTIENQGAPR